MIVIKRMNQKTRNLYDSSIPGIDGFPILDGLAQAVMKLKDPAWRQNAVRQVTKLGLLLLLAGFISLNSHAQTITIGAGAASGTSSNSATGDPGPMYRSGATSNFVYSRHHYLYTAAELSAAGLVNGSVITALAWNKDNNAATNSPAAFEIWMKNSSLTTVQAAPQTWATLTTGSNQVYNAPTTVTAAIGWVNFTLSAPLTYTGGALEISVAFDISSGTSPWTTAGFSWKKDNISNRTISYCNSTAGTTLDNDRTVRPQLQITYTPGSPCTNPPTPGTATATQTGPFCSGTATTLSLTGNSIGSGLTYEWESSPTNTPFTPTSLGAPGPAPALTITPSATRWYRAKLVCSSGTPVYSAPIQVQVSPLFPAGTYTINKNAPPSATNYQSFTTAVSALSCGIAGPVVFNVVPGSGPYTEQVSIPAIFGTSATNTVTFNGRGETMQATPVTGTRHLIQLDGADHIILDSLTLLGQSATYGWGVHLQNGADSNIVSHCKINMSAVTSTTQSNSAGIVVAGSTSSVTTDGSASYNTFRDNDINGAYQGIIINGATGSLDAVRNTIVNNEIHDFYANGIEITNTDSVIIANNNIHRTARTAVTTFAGIEVGAECKKSRIDANRIHDSHTAATTQTGTAYGIFYNACDAAVGAENVSTNNLIYKMNSGSGTIYGIYNNGSQGAFYYHNTIVLDNAASTAGVTRGFFQTGASTNIRFRNNIVHIARGGTGLKYCLYFATTTSTITSNNNDLLNTSTAGTNGVGYYSSGQTTLANWQAVNSNAYDQQSVSINPAYTVPATGDYKPTATTLDNLGGQVGIPTDILNIQRDVTAPDMGAYEFGCPVVQGLTASAITSATATLTWTGGPGATAYEYVLDQVAGNPAGAGTATTATTYNASGLNPVTVYYMHVRSSCGSGVFSAWRTISFTTLCQGPGAAITYTGATTFCDGNSLVMNAPTGTGFTYQWNRNAGPITGATSVSYTATQAGSYTVTVTDPAASCSTTTPTPVVVTVNPLPPTNITASGSVIFCTGGSVNLCAPVPPSGTTYAYVWKDNNVAIPGQTAQCMNVTTSRNVTVTVTNTTTTCSATTPTATVVNAGAPPAAPISAAGSATICQGQTVRLRTNNASGLSYQWKLGGNPIPGAIDSFYNAGVAGSYTVDVSITGTTGCSSTSSALVVTVNALPTAAITASGAPTTFCQGGAVTLTANTGTGLTYQWQNGSSPVTPANTTATHNATASGTYTVIVTNTSTSCFNTSNAITVTVNPLPVATVTPVGATAICAGAGVVLNANSGTGLTYEWANGGTPIPGATSSSYTATAAGAYTVKVTNANNCSNTSTPAVNVTVNPLPPTAISPTGPLNICSGSSVTLNGPTGTGLTYQWKNGTANASGTSTSASYTATAAGTYRLVVTTAAGCKDSSAVATVSVLPLPTVTMTPSAPATACDSVVLNTTSANITYQWNYNNAPILGANSNRYAARATGNYSLSGTSTANGCSATTSNVAITVNQTPAAQITYSSPLTFCEGSAVVLNTYSGQNLTYEWRDNNVAIPGATTRSYTAMESGLYTVRVANTVTGCAGVSPAVSVQVNQLPVPAVTYNSTTNTLTTTQPYMQYQWLLNNQPLTGANQRTYSPQQSGAYLVNVTDANGCVGQSQIFFVNNVGIVNTAIGRAIRIYPNPTSGQLYVQSPVNVSLVLRDVTGKAVLKEQNKDALNLEPLADGMYLLFITDPAGQLIRAEKITKSAY